LVKVTAGEAGAAALAVPEVIAVIATSTAITTLAMTRLGLMVGS
jgi:hypothetical protein